MADTVERVVCAVVGRHHGDADARAAGQHRAAACGRAARGDAKRRLPARHARAQAVCPSGGTLEDPDHPPRGVLYCIEADGRATAIRLAMRVPNSLAFSPKIWAYDYDAETGATSNERIFATPHPGFPDGSCIDADGCLWNAEWGASRVVRYTPDGKIDRVIAVPAKNPTCCAFGGTRLDTLYITSADRAGVFALAPGVKGLAESRFG